MVLKITQGIYKEEADFNKNQKPLEGKVVVVTRARNQSFSFAEKLTLLGANVIFFPVIETIGIACDEFENAVEKINIFDWIIFTSVNAVEYFFSKISEKKINTENFKNIKFAVVGSKTLKKLQEYGFKAEIIPPKFVAESLIDSFKKIDLKNKKVLFPHAFDARSIITEELEKMGAEIYSYVIYKTIEPDNDDIKKNIKYLTDTQIDYITFTSPSGIKNFFNILKNFSLKNISTSFVCIGNITADSFEKLTGKKCLIAKEHTIEGIIEIILEDTKKGLSKK